MEPGLLYDVADLLLGIMLTSPPVNLPPPMTRQEVYAQKLYAADCLTTRKGVEMSCEAAFHQDLNRAYAFEEENKK